MKLDSLAVTPRWLRVVALCVLALIVSVFAWWPMLAAAPQTQGGDGGFFHKSLEAARVSVVRHHELPQWNPYDCGGAPLWSNPQLMIGAPLVWPLYALGTLKTMHLWYVVHSAIGFVAMWLFARHELRVRRSAAFFAAATWAFCGFHQQHYGGGHFAFVPFLYFPGALLLWRRAERDLRAAVLLGLLVAWMILEGGIYPLPHLAVVLGIETLLRLRSRERALRIALAGAVVVAVGLTVGAVRFLPVLDELRAHKRALGDETDAIQWSTLRDMFVARDHERFVPGQQYVWPEYGAYVGPIVLGLALVGVVLCGVEEAWLLLLLVACFALMLGHAGRFAPWTFLKAHVFPFTQMRVPSRFRAEVSLFLVAFAALAVDRIADRARPWLRSFGRVDAARSTVAALALLGAGDVVSVGITCLRSAFGGPPEATQITPSGNLHFEGGGTALIDLPRANRGRLQCWEEWAFGEGAPLWTGDVPQARARDERAVVTNVRRTQHRFTFDVHAREAATILLNSAWDRGFRTNVGTLREEAKQLVLDVPAGVHRVQVVYETPKLRVGAAVSGVGLAAVIVAHVRSRRRR